jgi:hypothetical protein
LQAVDIAKSTLSIKITVSPDIIFCTAISKSSTIVASGRFNFLTISLLSISPSKEDKGLMASLPKSSLSVKLSI